MMQFAVFAALIALIVAERKYKAYEEEHLFTVRVMAVLKEIYFHENLTFGWLSLRSFAERAISICKAKDTSVYPEFESMCSKQMYDIYNFWHDPHVFAYECALKYVQRYPDDDIDRCAVEKHCNSGLALLKVGQYGV